MLQQLRTHQLKELLEKAESMRVTAEVQQQAEQVACAAADGGDSSSMVGGGDGGGGFYSRSVHDAALARLASLLRQMLNDR
jgi:hypothetical protein